MVDAGDLKSPDRKVVRVRLPLAPPANLRVLYGIRVKFFLIGCFSFSGQLFRGIPFLSVTLAIRGYNLNNSATVPLVSSFRL